jgi:hypothetical protein
MQCKYCNQPVGSLRRLTGSPYCSSAHQKAAESGSARAARDQQYFYTDDDLLAAMRSVSKERKKPSKTNAQFAMVMATVGIVLLVVAFQIGGPSRGNATPGPQLTSRNSATNSASRTLGFLDKITSSLRARGPLRLREDFSDGVSAWSATGRQDGWRVGQGLIHPGRLRLWEPSLSLSNYRVDFEGQIESRAMSWVFRARNKNNYYATKLQVRSRGALSSADIVRYIVVDGKERDRVTLPLPMSIRPDSFVNINLQIRGNRFETAVNGQPVDMWIDQRINRGGFGFFSDRGESAAIHWVDLVEDKPSLLSNIFATAFFVPPGNTMR